MLSAPSVLTMCFNTWTAALHFTKTRAWPTQTHEYTRRARRWLNETRWQRCKVTVSNIVRLCWCSGEAAEPWRTFHDTHRETEISLLIWGWWDKADVSDLSTTYPWARPEPQPQAFSSSNLILNCLILTKPEEISDKRNGSNPAAPAFISKLT